MSVVGFDIGNYKSSIGVARAGGIDIIANEYSDRITPSYVSFTNNERYQGHSAKQQEITNSANTISGFKRLLGRKQNDPQVQNERTFHPMRLTQGSDEKIKINVDYLNETREFSPEQIMGMFLTKLKSIAETNINSKVTDCVISVPCYMTDTERRALLDASQVAGLNCLKLINETTAVALTYGLYHSNLPEANEKPHIVAFVDMGYTHLQASIVAFHKGKLRVMATTFDNNLGGRDLDKLLTDYFEADFKKRYNLDANSSVRAKLRLRSECEKLKKLLSSIATPIPLNIECFLNDTDVQGKMKRDDFEVLAEPLLARVRRVFEELLIEAKIETKDIDLVEIVGGSTRVPAVKHLVQQVFGKEPSTTLNADEACARGCTIMCAILSPNFKVKEFKIEDCQLFPITLSWKGAETDDNELEVFPRFEKIPLSKLLTIYKREPFEIEARYRFPNNIPFNDPRIGKFHIGNVTPNAQGENSEIKLKARITKNGIFEISSPQQMETVEVEVNVPVSAPQAAENKGAPNQEEQKQQQDENQAERKNSDLDNEDSNINEGDVVMNGGENGAAAAAGNAAGAPGQPTQKQIKKKTKAIDLPLTPRVPQLSKNEINLLLEQELSMIQQDRKEKERSEAKNSVEEYIYDMREKLSNEYEKFIHEENKNTFLRLLDDTESWLYSDDADNQEKNVYLDRLQSLKNFGEPVRKRYKESQERPHFLEEYGRSLQQIKKAIDLYQKNDERYNHLEKADVERVYKCAEEKQRWFEEKSNLLSKMRLTDDPCVLASQIKDEKDSMDKTCWAILNKPKPKVEPPKPPKEPESPKGQQQQQQGPQAQPQPQGQQQQANQQAQNGNGEQATNQQQQQPQQKMEVD